MVINNLAVISIAIIAIAGVIIRPWKLPEAIWAVSGASLLVIFKLLPLGDAGDAVMKGLDVYLFLTGMMLLSELARTEGVFDNLAALAVKTAKGSQTRLFFLIYATGTLVTIFMSNDATAVVLTPAVFAAVKAAKAKPLPYLFICAFIANAASFVLPISNPANLVVFASHMPPLGEWLERYGLPSVAAIGVTYILLRFMQRKELSGSIELNIVRPALSATGRITACGIVLTAISLMVASRYDLQLGWPTLICAGFTTLVVLITKKEMPGPILKDISWGVLPLVAGLFVLVEGLNHIGIIHLLGTLLHDLSIHYGTVAAFGSGIVIAVICNLMNNLPVGLISGMLVAQIHASALFTDAVLIGVDLGPNLSITGSLATILWLTCLRREGEHVSAWQFLKLGMLLMPLGLIAALAVLLMGL